MTSLDMIVYSYFTIMNAFSQAKRCLIVEWSWRYEFYPNKYSKMCIYLFKCYLETDNTLLCDWRFKYTGHITVYLVLRKHFLIMFTNASELLENIEEMCPRYWYFGFNTNSIASASDSQQCLVNVSL